MKMECPMTYFQDNLIFTQQGTCYAGYEIKTHAYKHKSNPEKGNIRQQAINMLKRTESGHIKILGKPWTKSIRAGAEQFKRTFHGPLADLARNHIDWQTDYLVSKVGDESNTIKKFMLAELKKSDKKGFGKVIDDVKGVGSMLFDTVDNAFGVKSYDIPVSQLNSYYDREKAMSQRIGSYVKRIDESTVEWLQVQPFYRGVGEPKLRTKTAEKYAKDSGEQDIKPWRPDHEIVNRKGKKVLVPRLQDVLTLGGGLVKIDHEEPHVKIHHNNGRVSYQTFLSVSFIDEGLVFPDYEFLYWLESLGFPVEYEVDIDIYDSKTSQGQVKKQKNTVKDQMKHMVEGGDVPDSIIDGIREADELTNELHNTKSDYYKVNINICVFADNYELMETRAQTVINHFDDLHITLERSTADQGKFFVEFFPGSRKVSKAFTKQMLPRVLCSGIFNGTEELGDPFGYYIAALGNLEQPVFYDPSRAALNDKSPAISSIGTLGGGKTLLMMFLGYLNALSGNKTMIINPKGDSSRVRENLPEDFQEHLDILMLSGANEYRGILDPYLVYDLKNLKGRDLEEAEKSAFGLAVTIWSFLANAKMGDRKYLAISKACKKALRASTPCMQRVIEFYDDGWKEDPKTKLYEAEYNDLSILAETAQEFAATSLLISDGESKALSIEKPMTIIDIQGLSMPEKDKKREDLTMNELLSLVILMPLLEHAKRFGFSQKDLVKFLGIDEQWFIKLVEMGRQFMESMVRQGRSLFTTTYLIDQNATSISEEMRNCIGIKNIYRMEAPEEAITALEYVGMEVNDFNIDMILGMKERHILHQDLEGRTGIVRVDIPEEFVEAFTSRPELREGDGGDKVA